MLLENECQRDNIILTLFLFLFKKKLEKCQKNKIYLAYFNHFIIFHHLCNFAHQKLTIPELFKSVGNSICKNNTSLYFLGFFSIIILSVYIKKIFLSIFTNEYRKNSP
jgi:hypothetical protein